MAHLHSQPSGVFVDCRSHWKSRFTSEHTLSFAKCEASSLLALESRPARLLEPAALQQRCWWRAWCVGGNPNAAPLFRPCKAKMIQPLNFILGRRTCAHGYARNGLTCSTRQGTTTATDAKTSGYTPTEPCTAPLQCRSLIAWVTALSKMPTSNWLTTLATRSCT